MQEYEKLAAPFPETLHSAIGSDHVSRRRRYNSRYGGIPNPT